MFIAAVGRSLAADGPSPTTRAIEDAKRTNEAVKATGLGRTCLYECIAAGELKSIKVGGRRPIMRENLMCFLCQRSGD
jgi:excisionase family DNA binding protein